MLIWTNANTDSQTVQIPQTKRVYFLKTSAQMVMTCPKLAVCWRFNLFIMPSIQINLGNPDEYSGEEYKECRRWVHEIASLDYDGSIHISVDALMSEVFKGKLDDVAKKLRKGDLGKCIESIGEKKFCVRLSELRYVIKLANRILSPIGGGSLSLTCLLFLLTVASYVVATNENAKYLHLINILNGGQKVTNVSKIFTMDELDVKFHIGALSKLLGILEPQTGEMDCPRVWDLVDDCVVDNPNLKLTKDFHPIVAITHRWAEDETTYASVSESKKMGRVLETMTEFLNAFYKGPTLSSSEAEKLAKSLTNLKEAKSRKKPKQTKLDVIRDELLDMDIRYVWIDTLCIDKTSSAETDEAIRSMYRWYNSAYFVYLESDTSLESWSTRGWTLQEGAAAKALRVASDRADSFLELLSKERWSDDKIRRLALVASYIPNSPMYWINLMNSRMTTKVEDRAYALVGLLGLDFQSAYGEGKRASTRLYEELVRQKGDVTWLMDPKFRNGNWTNPSHQTRGGEQYKISMQEVCYRKNLVPSYEEVRMIGPAIKIDAVEITGEHLRILRKMKVYNNYSYADSFAISDDCTEMLTEIAEVKYWWIPSSNIILYLCKYKKGGEKGFWRIISVRGTTDAWEPPSPPLKLENITVDYNTVVYKPDPEDDIQPDDYIDNMVRGLEVGEKTP